MNRWGLATAAVLFWLAPLGAGIAEERDARRASGAADGIETENLFGFSAGSDTGEAESKGVGVEAVLRSGKRIGTYRALGSKLEFGFGVADDLNMSFAALGDCRRVRNVPDLDDVRGRCGFNGFGAEVRWRFLDRKAAPLGLTLQVEPSFRRFGELSGQVGRALVLENKLIFDRELVADTVFGAINLIYDLERVRERFADSTERGSLGGVSGALALRLSPTIFVGGELRYLRAYEGLAFRRFAGNAIYVGPTLFAQLSEKSWLAAAWNVQVAGREALDRPGIVTAVAAALEAGEDPLSAVPVRRSRLDLKNFERHQIKLKAGFDF